MNTKNNQRFRDTEIRMEAAMLDIMKHTEFVYDKVYKFDSVYIKRNSTRF